MLEMNRETKIVYDYMIGYEQESDHFIEDLVDNEYSYEGILTYDIEDKSETKLSYCLTITNDFSSWINSWWVWESC